MKDKSIKNKFLQTVRLLTDATKRAYETSDKLRHFGLTYKQREELMRQNRKANDDRDKIYKVAGRVLDPYMENQAKKHPELFSNYNVTSMTKGQNITLMASLMAHEIARGNKVTIGAKTKKILGLNNG